MNGHSLIKFLSPIALVAVSVVGAQSPPSPATTPLRYRLIDLGTLGGANSSEGSTVPIVNNQGVVTGGSDILLIDPNCVFLPNCLDLHAFRWDSGTLADLGTLPGGNNSLANAINGHGQIAGVSENGVFDSFLDSPVTRPVLWENGLVIDLGDFGGPNGFANSINNRGQVVGAVQTDIPDPVVGTQFRDSQRLFGARFGLRFEDQSVARIHVLQPKLFSLDDAEWLGKLASFLDHFVGVYRHLISLLNQGQDRGTRSSRRSPSGSQRGLLTSENRSVRTGQVELANRRQDLALPKFNQQPTNAETIERHTAKRELSLARDY